MWGASFPLAVATAADERRDSASLVGGLYSANTLGAIVGTLVVSLFAVPLFDGQFAQQLLTLCAGLSGIVMLSSCHKPLRASLGGSSAIALLGHEEQPSQQRSAESGEPPRQARWGSSAPVIAVGVLACGLAVALVPEVPKGLLAYGRTVEQWPTTREYFFVGEGLDSPVVVSESEAGFRCFHVAGKVEATNSPSDMRTQRLLGHLPAMAHPEPRTVLVVGCGSGMTTGAFLRTHG